MTTKGRMVKMWPEGDVLILDLDGTAFSFPAKELLILGETIVDFAQSHVSVDAPLLAAGERHLKLVGSSSVGKAPP